MIHMSKKVTFGPLPSGFKLGPGEIAGGRDYAISPILNFRHVSKESNKKSKPFVYRNDIVRQFIVIKALDNVKIYNLLIHYLPDEYNYVMDFSSPTCPTINFNEFDWKRDIINETNIIEFCEFLSERIRTFTFYDIPFEHVDKYDELETILCNYYKIDPS